MEATQHTRVHEPVGASTAIRNQIRLLWMTRRPLMLLVAMLGGLALAGPPWGSGENARLLSFWGWLLLAGPVWALAVFHNEGPSQRLYHWSQPVARHVHTLARVAAGAAWLWAVCAVLIAMAFALGALDGNAGQLRALPFEAWLNLFTAPLIGYLGISILAVASDRPIVWLFGIVFLVPFVLAMAARAFDMEPLAELLATPLIAPGWGLAAALVGAMEPAVREIVGAGGSGAGFDISGWRIATVAWIMAFGALTTLMATIHPDARLHLRR